MLPSFFRHRELPQQSPTQALPGRTSHILLNSGCLNGLYRRAVDHSSFVDISDISFGVLLLSVFRNQLRNEFPFWMLRLMDNLTASSAKAHRLSHWSSAAEFCASTAFQNKSHLIVESFMGNSFVLTLMQPLPGRFLRAFASSSSHVTQPRLKPSFFRPSPALRNETIAVIRTIVYFALAEDELPRTHGSCLL